MRCCTSPTECFPRGSQGEDFTLSLEPRSRGSLRQNQEPVSQRGTPDASQIGRSNFHHGRCLGHSDRRSLSAVD